MQPFIQDASEVVRFKDNAIVKYMLGEGGLNLNDLTAKQILFTQSDWEQFYQLIGYSLSGYHEIPGVSDASCREASEQARQQGFPSAKGCRDDGCPVHCGVGRES